MDELKAKLVAAEAAAAQMKVQSEDLGRSLQVN